MAEFDDSIRENEVLALPSTHRRVKKSHHKSLYRDTFVDLTMESYNTNGRAK